MEKKQRRTVFDQGDEMRYFLANNVLLADFPNFSNFRNATKPFDVIRANIIIRGIANRNAFVKVIKTLREHEGEKNIEELAMKTLQKSIEGLPFYIDGATRIYMPFLPKTMNDIFLKSPEKLLQKKYLNLFRHSDSICVDPFDEYGPDLYNSTFTQLILVRRGQDSNAYYDYDSASIYFVNKQGRLDCRIAVFDRGIRRPNTHHMMQRLEPVVDAYYEFDKEKMKNALVDNQLISSSLLYKLNNADRLHNAKISKTSSK
ncbi:MAG: hypothetical protein K6F32_05220 [Bacilli bacterium]|nr:hypothetical protein [Bacilli bacterium]